MKANRLNQLVSVRGVVGDYRSSWSARAPDIVFLQKDEKAKDGGEPLEIVYWPQDATVQIPDFTQMGTPIYATGILQEYRGRLQLKIDDLYNLSTKPLPPERLWYRYVPDNSATTPVPPPVPRDKLTWMPYSPLAVQSKLDKDGYAIIYVRSEQVPYCRSIERSYLLHPDTAKAMGSQTIYFINAQEEDGRLQAQQLAVDRVPMMMVLYSGGARENLIFSPKTKPTDVYQFFQAIPKATQ